MIKRTSIILLTSLALLAGCAFEELNTGAASSSNPNTPGSGGAGNAGASGSASIAGSTGASGSPGASGGPGASGDTGSEDQLITEIDTPPIEYTTPDGTTTTSTSACDATTAQATSILTKNCVKCHGGGPGQMMGQPPFNFVLDFAKLVTARSATVPDPTAPVANQIPGTPDFLGMRFVIPGDPLHSRVYLRAKAGIAGSDPGGMPPADIVGVPSNPDRQSISDVSVLREWITDCLGDLDTGSGAGAAGASGSAP